MDLGLSGRTPAWHAGVHEALGSICSTTAETTGPAVHLAKEAGVTAHEALVTHAHILQYTVPDCPIPVQWLIQKQNTEGRRKKKKKKTCSTGPVRRLSRYKNFPCKPGELTSMPRAQNGRRKTIPESCP